MIDLDHNATTPLDPRVRQAMVEVLQDPALQANPSSLHRGGQRARAVVDGARRRIAAALNAEPLEITLTSGGTEADNLAVLGAARWLRDRGRPAGIVTSALEHPAVLQSARRLQRDGHSLHLAEVDRCGRIDADGLAATLRADPSIGVVSLALANHELGNVTDVHRVAQVVREARSDVVIHTDAVQALGKIAVDFAQLDVDLMSISGHKIHGPKGIGALLHRRRIELEPLWHGGGQQRGRRTGTEAPFLAHGLAAAVELATSEQAERLAHTQSLRRRLVARLGRIDGVEIHGDPEHGTGNTVLATFAGCDGQLLAMALDLEGFAVSTGAACSSGNVEPSPGLLALGCSETQAASAVRFSVGRDNRETDIEALLQALPGIVERVREAEADRSRTEVAS